MKKKRPTTATTDQVTLWVEEIAELEWSDWIEVAPGQWDTHPDARPKIKWLEGQLKIRLAEIDAYIEDHTREIQMIGEKWVATSLKQ